MITTFFTILGATLLGIMSPGPSFLMVAQTAIAKSRLEGVVMAIGMGLGSFVLSASALFGLHILLNSMPWLYYVIRIAGALYLLYISYKIWLGANNVLHIKEQSALETSYSFQKSFLTGFFTNLSNPKTIMFYASIFSVLLPTSMALTMAAVLLITIFFLSFGWYGLIAVVLSSKTLAQRYIDFKPYIDKFMACFLAILGFNLLFNIIR